MMPKERLLEYHVCEGWAPHCSFVEQNVPQGPFSDGNEGPRAQRLIQELVTSVGLWEDFGFGCCDLWVVLLVAAMWQSHCYSFLERLFYATVVQSDISNEAYSYQIGHIR